VSSRHGSGAAAREEVWYAVRRSAEAQKGPLRLRLGSLLARGDGARKRLPTRRCNHDARKRRSATTKRTTSRCGEAARPQPAKRRCLVFHVEHTRAAATSRSASHTPMRSSRCAAAASPRAARPGGGNTGKRRGGDASHDAAAKRGYAAYHSRGMWLARRLRAARRRKGSEAAAKAACPGLWPVPDRIGCDTVRRCPSRTQRRTPPRGGTKPKGTPIARYP